MTASTTSAVAEDARAISVTSALERSRWRHPRAGSGLLHALRLLEVSWIMSAMRLLSCVPRFLSLSALAIRTRSVAV